MWAVSSVRNVSLPPFRNVGGRAHTTSIHNTNNNTNEVTVYENGATADAATAHAVPIKPGAGIPAPIAAGPIFAYHSLKNTVKVT